ncbi:unnamed protein product [Chondrus crispus]|uniref:Uncharacterized protein n=1 Tax=Chondrus crispus TaxID=2769 RepID=S0F3N5_CHOCR|nr:unnamed protein product [Chondrus crispus]CDF77569.1 unnamed protein product [Chondrus crispus]|eukprot:XP_005718070.1 unnamed protein product [Chondrus crispus]
MYMCPTPVSITRTGNLTISGSPSRLSHRIPRCPLDISRALHHQLRWKYLSKRSPTQPVCAHSSAALFSLSVSSTYPPNSWMPSEHNPFPTASQLSASHHGVSPPWSTTSSGPSSPPHSSGCGKPPLFFV